MQIWDRIIPTVGYIVPQYHGIEEALTFLSGTTKVAIEDETYLVEANTTLFINSFSVHAAVNQGDEPARLIAVLVSAHPKVIYTNEPPETVVW
ncbi:MAG: cupin domain-containing protein [Anaerolineaceae bacterium]|nr:MAG: cupin domain-containing protein [Anaerolineaceae bacterium]